MTLVNNIDHALIDSSSDTNRITPERLSPKIPGEIKPLTSARGIAALLVVIYHGWDLFYHSSPGMPSQNFPFFKGYLFVDFFFLLSGFIIAYVHSADFETWNPKSYQRFLLLRLIRIYPVHFFTLMLALLLECTKFLFPINNPPFSFNTPASFSQHLTLIQAWGFDAVTRWNLPSWSVSVEWFAYIVTPIVFFLTLYRRWFVATGIVLLCLAVLWFLEKGPWNLNLTAHYALARGVAEYAIGSVLYRIHSTVKLHISIDNLLAICLLLTALNIATQGDDVVSVILFALDILGLSLANNWIKKLFSLRIPMYLGRVSYSLYMVHGFALAPTKSICSKLGSEPALIPLKIAIFGGFVLISLAGAELCYRYVEKPARRFRHTLVRGRATLPMLSPRREAS
jgi:peptidoglycan/LPS O-acetylase OafA/YrhL